MEGNKKIKKTLGRRKIEIKKIDKQTTLQVTFSKRRRGLFRKASELSLLSGAEVAIVVQSPAEKVFTFGHPSVEALLNRVSAPSSARNIIRHDDRGRRNYEEAIEMLEAEKSRNDGGFWWEKPFEGLELHQLEEFLADLQRQRDDVAERVEMFESFTINSAAASVQEPSVAASIQEFSAAAHSAAAPVQEFSGADLSIQEFSATALSTAAPVQEFSSAASALDSSYLSQPFDQDQDLFDVLDSLINSDAAAQVQEFSAASAAVQEFTAPASIQESSGGASGSDSSYHSHPFDEDQDLFDGLDLSYLFQPSDLDQDFHGMFN